MDGRPVRLADIHCPVLNIAASRDPIAPRPTTSVVTKRVGSEDARRSSSRAGTSGSSSADRRARTCGRRSAPGWPSTTERRTRTPRQADNRVPEIAHDIGPPDLGRRLTGRPRGPRWWTSGTSVSTGTRRRPGSPTRSARSSRSTRSRRRPRWPSIATTGRLPGGRTSGGRSRTSSRCNPRLAPPGPSTVPSRRAPSRRRSPPRRAFCSWSRTCSRSGVS